MPSMPNVIIPREDGGEQSNVEVSVISNVAYGPSLATISVNTVSLGAKPRG